MRDLRHDLGWALSKNEFPVVLVHALERAIKAEERVAWLEKRLAFVEDSETLLGEELAKCRKEIARLKSDAGWDFESKPDWRRQEVE